MIRQNKSVYRFEVQDYINKGYRCYYRPDIDNKEYYSKSLKWDLNKDSFWIGSTIFVKNRRK